MYRTYINLSNITAIIFFTLLFFTVYAANKTLKMMLEASTDLHLSLIKYVLEKKENTLAGG